MAVLPCHRRRERIGIELIAVLSLIYVCLNLIAAGVFAWDKWKSVRNAHRTSENALLVLAFFGPFGAFAAMQVCRHKTRKMKFRLVPLFLAIHLAVFLSLILRPV